MLLQKYIQELDYSETFKSRFFNKELLHRHSFYTHLVDYFRTLYVGISEAELIKLSGCSYLYFRTLIFMDNVIDKQVKDEELPNLLVYIDLFEKSVKDLSGLFNQTSPFWESFKTLKENYKNYVFEEKHLNKLKENFERAKFEELAHGKSIMCQAIIDALEVLNGETKYASELQEIVRDIHIAFQYRDDIDDFSRDSQEGQWTYAQSRVSQFLVEEGIELEGKYWKNALFVSGIAEELLINAISSYKKAQDVSKKLDLTLLNAFAVREIADCRNQLFEIKLIIEKSQAISEKSNAHLFSVSRKINKKTVMKSSTKTVDFLKTNVNEQGFWTDFVTSAGHSTMWVTGFVTSNLFEAGCIDPVNFANTRHYISKNKLKTGYSETTLSDGDTAAFSIAAHKSFSMDIDQDVLNDWFSYQHHNGGWATYKPSIELVNFIGLESVKDLEAWTNPQKCVSAYAFYLLAKHDFHLGKLATTYNYLKEDITKNGFVSSYWWTSPVYSTVYTLLGLNELGLVENTDFKKLEDYLRQTQTANGSWKDDFGNESSFYTSLATQCLLKIDAKKHLGTLNNSVNWLLGNQFTDGSFKVDHILRIPASNVYEKDFGTVDWRRGSLGMNVLVDDHNRVFTSSIALNAIKNFEKCL
jgi:hypothetical protein